MGRAMGQEDPTKGLDMGQEDPAMGQEDPAMGQEDPAMGLAMGQEDPAMGQEDPAMGRSRLTPPFFPAPLRSPAHSEKTTPSRSETTPHLA